jgi:mannitol/fructose-specific phosphotransferase system IIA component (Ntr-type)
MMDMDLFKTDVGMLVMGAAMFSDLVGWIIFSIILGMMNANAPPDSAVGGDHAAMGIGMTIALTLAIVALVLTIGRWLVDRSLPWIQSRLSWPGGVLSFTLVLTLAGAAATEWIGIHAIFGAFLVGIAVGDSAHMRSQTRTILHQFVTYIFAPIFFVSIGLEANFLEHFNLPLVLGVLAVAFIGKIAGCMLGAHWGGLSRRDGLAISFGMNARGAMEIILGLLALQYGVIQAEMFVALVVLALLSSIISGPMMNKFIDRPKHWKLEDLLNTKLYFPEMGARTRDDAIRELAHPAAEIGNLHPDVVAQAVLDRERIMGPSLGSEIAVPHARMDGLDRPILVVGHSKEGIDFDSPDGMPARLIFLLLTPEHDMSAQIQIMGQIARLFKDEGARDVLYDSESIEVVRAFVKTEAVPVH